MVGRKLLLLNELSSLNDQELLLKILQFSAPRIEDFIDYLQITLSAGSIRFEALDFDLGEFLSGLHLEHSI